MMSSRRLHGGGGVGAGETQPDDDLYHGVGVVFLAVCPLLGASVLYLANKGSATSAVPILNGFAGGVLLGCPRTHTPIHAAVA